MADDQDTPQFPEAGVDKLVSDFGKKPSASKVDEIKALAESLRPQYQKVEAARKLADQPKPERRQGKRM